MKPITAYRNDNNIEHFLKEKDEIVSVETGSFEYWGKKWTHKTIFKAKGKTNGICNNYNLGVAGDNTFVADGM